MYNFIRTFYFDVIGVLQSQELEKDFVMINKILEWFVYQDLIKVKNPHVDFVDIITLWILWVSGSAISLYQNSAAFFVGLVNETWYSFAIIVLLGKIQWHFSKSRYKQFILEYLWAFHCIDACTGSRIAVSFQSDNRSILFLLS